jgi:hypothetical protein
MLPGWQPCVILATLDNTRDRPAVDLKIESQIPSKVRRPQNDQMPTRLSTGSADRDYASESKNQKESVDVVGEAAHALIVARVSSVSRLA